MPQRNASAVREPLNDNLLLDLPAKERKGNFPSRIVAQVLNELRRKNPPLIRRHFINFPEAVRANRGAPIRRTLRAMRRS